MKLTFRSFTWEYGPIIAVVVGLPLSILPWVITPWIAFPICAASVAYCIYGFRLTRRYQCRGDLPEWKEHQRRELAELDHWRFTQGE